MKKAFEDLEAVVPVRLDPCSVDEFYSSILECVGFKYDGINKRFLVKKALQQIKSKGGRKPTFVVEINEKCDPQQLISVLVQVKSLGADSCLANFFIVASTSQAPLLIPITFK